MPIKQQISQGGAKRRVLAPVHHFFRKTQGSPQDCHPPLLVLSTTGERKMNPTKFLTTALLAILTLTLSASALAGTIGISGGRLIVGTEAGDVDQVFAPTISGQNIVFDNLTFDIVTPGCTGAGSISCSLADFQELVILGGNGDDIINLFGISPVTFAITALGAGGDDILIGTPGTNIRLFGGTGDDILEAANGNCVSGGIGANIIIGGSCNAGDEPTIAPLPRQTSEVPEPSELMLMGTGLTIMVGRLKRRLKK
jgi:hypothetical protein